MRIRNRKSIRLKGFDYSSGWFFVTINTNNRLHLFGEIVNDVMFLNRIGKTVKNNWLEIPKHFENIILDEYVLMPNHLHGILFLKNVGVGHARPLPHRTLPTIIGSFKSSVTKGINEINSTKIPLWQRYYYDRVIRNEDELNRIRKYIRENPKRWDIN